MRQILSFSIIWGYGGAIWHRNDYDEDTQNFHFAYIEARQRVISAMAVTCKVKTLNRVLLALLWLVLAQKTTLFTLFSSFFGHIRNETAVTNTTRTRVLSRCLVVGRHRLTFFLKMLLFFPMEPRQSLWKVAINPNFNHFPPSSPSSPSYFCLWS